MSGGVKESRTCQQVSRGEGSPGNPLLHQPHERRLVVLQQLRSGQRLHPVAEQAVDLDAELGPLDCHIDLSRARTRQDFRRANFATSAKVVAIFAQILSLF